MKRTYPLYPGCLVELWIPPVGSAGRSMIPPRGSKGQVKAINPIEDGQALVAWNELSYGSWCPMPCLRLVG